MLSCQISQLRQNLGMNQQQLARALHLSPSTVGMYEQGRRTPNIEILIQMSKLFNVSLDYLLTGSEFTPDPNKQHSAVSCSPSCYNCCCRKLLDYIRENMSPNDSQKT